MLGSCDDAWYIEHNGTIFLTISKILLERDKMFSSTTATFDKLLSVTTCYNLDLSVNASEVSETIHVNARFHTSGIVWNCGLTQKISSPWICGGILLLE